MQQKIILAPRGPAIGPPVLVSAHASPRIGLKVPLTEISLPEPPNMLHRKRSRARVPIEGQWVLLQISFRKEILDFF